MFIFGVEVGIVDKVNIIVNDIISRKSWFIRLFRFRRIK